MALIQGLVALAGGYAAYKLTKAAVAAAPKVKGYGDKKKSTKKKQSKKRSK